MILIKVFDTDQIGEDSDKGGFFPDKKVNKR
jgi:hypothetical protein